MHGYKRTVLRLAHRLCRDKSLELYVARDNRIIELITYRADGKPGYWPCDTTLDNVLWMQSAKKRALDVPEGKVQHVEGDPAPDRTARESVP